MGEANHVYTTAEDSAPRCHLHLVSRLIMHMPICPCIAILLHSVVLN